MHLTGRAYITVKGQRLRTEPGATLKTGGLSREGVAADTGVAGYTEAVSIPEVTCSLIHAADIKIADYNAMVSETISFDTDTGKSFVLSEAWCKGALELSAGKVQLVFQAMRCEEVA